MPEETQNTGQLTQATSLGWRAGLPDDLKQNETFAGFKTVGEFAKSYLDTQAKVADLTGKLESYVPKLPDDASDEERNLYFTALGRPKTASEYKIDGEDKNAPEWTEWSRNTLWNAGLTQKQADMVVASWNGMMQKIVDANNQRIQNEIKASDEKLRSEFGDKYDTNVELAKRLYAKHIGGEFDKAFDAGTSTNRADMIRYLVKLAAKTGEDRTPSGGTSQRQAGVNSFITYDKSPEPPKRF